MSKRNPNAFRPSVVELERREVPAVASVQLFNGVLTVRCNNANTTAVVSQNAFGVQVQDVVANRFWKYSAGQVHRIDLLGGNGNDTLTSRGNTGILVRTFGGNGNDTLLGSNGRDIMRGGVGNDKIYGQGGNDVITGDAGNDTIDGGAGDDILFGGDGNDWLKGGAGNDAISGDAGNDTLISLDDATNDVVDGGSGTDVLWMDKNGNTTDKQTGIDNLDAINAVAAFSNAGADRTLDGDRIVDPLTLPGDKYERFTNRPLFSSQGPTVKDFSQGQLGDCWLLAGIGGVTLVRPDIIRSHVVDFGDGTYGVRLADNFYRVDNDFAVAQSGNVTLQYTAPGLENSLWVAVMEKAYTHYRTGANTFASIDGGNSSEVFPALGLDTHVIVFHPTLAPLPLIQMSSIIEDMVDNKTAPTIGVFTVPGSIQLVSSHQYILLRYTIDKSTGMVGTVDLRNPWGVDGPTSGPNPFSDSNFYDGVVTITLAELAQLYGSFEWGS